MPNRSPPLLALRAFDAAARHLSFTLAAGELHLTQGAISRQIRTLEDFLGKKLFIRYTRRIELTETGEEYHQAIRQAMQLITQATHRVMNEGERTVLTVSVLPTLGSRWLMPRLAHFSERHPYVDIRLISSIEPVNFQGGGVDLAIRVGRVPGDEFPDHCPRIDLEMVTQWKDVQAHYLLPDTLVPLMSRKLLDRHGPIQRPADLLAHRLIHTASRRHAWEDWLHVHGVRLPTDAPRLEFGHFFMGIEAAREGKGVAIVPSIFLEQPRDDTDDSDDLVCPLPADVESAGAYHLLTCSAHMHDASVRLFSDWLISEADASLHWLRNHPTPGAPIRSTPTPS